MPIVSGQLLVLFASVIWILFCMRFWYAIDREHTWQRRFIAIGAGIGGGLIYLIGVMMLQMLKEPELKLKIEKGEVQEPGEIRVYSRPPADEKK
ncbi:MAG: hypothetical protein WAW39_15620 [Prosthecobacter sp.]|uniref:hypothetical protein n=1 Tax=Prosthecobacter sp. TaxID=1965333 RepID=UPI003BAFBD2C